MGYLRIIGNEWNFNEEDRQLKEQFINGINDDNVISKIMRPNHNLKD